MDGPQQPQGTPRAASPADSAAKRADREARLATALRQNLRRRKQSQRDARSGPMAED
jgi:hypothetical protein